MKKSIVALFFLLLISSCELATTGAKVLFEKDKLLGTWKIISAVDVNSYEFYSPRSAEDRLLYKTIFSFFDDGTYTEINAHSYQAGTFTRTNEFVVLTKPDGSIEQMELEIPESGGLFLTGIRYGVRLKLGFKKKSDPLSNAKDDPFHAAKNKWRIQPTQPENDEALKARVRNQLEHNVAILEGPMELKKYVYSWEYSPTCVNVYRNGVGVRHSGYLDEGYLKCFYDLQQAKDAYELTKKALEAVPTNSNKDDTAWAVKDVAILKEVLSKF